MSIQKYEVKWKYQGKYQRPATCVVIPGYSDSDDIARMLVLQKTNDGLAGLPDVEIVSTLLKSEEGYDEIVPISGTCVLAKITLVGGEYEAVANPVALGIWSVTFVERDAPNTVVWSTELEFWDAALTAEQAANIAYIVHEKELLERI